VTLRWAERRNQRAVSSAKQRSTRFSRDELPDLQARPVYHPQARFRRGPPDHRLRRPRRHQADRSANRLAYQEFVKTARRCRTIEVQAGRQTITAADPVPADMRQALSALNRPS
jgi:hypothetical protein